MTRNTQRSTSGAPPRRHQHLMLLAMTAAVAGACAAAAPAYAANAASAAAADAHAAATTSSATAAASAQADAADADAAAPIDTVVISASRDAQSRFDAPAAIDVVNIDALHATTPLVNLSELLSAVPGVQVRNRENYAQDLQVSVRGFGTRSTFGVRGVRILVDGIPATMPDGQGQAATASLTAASRIEVLRGPMAQLYGNSAGGVVQVFTRDPVAGPLSGTISGGVGSYGQRQEGVSLTGGSATLGANIDISHFTTDGYRDHSAAERTQVSAKAVAHISSDTTVTAILNYFKQPTAQDPLGLTRDAASQNPRQVIAGALTFDTRKSIEQTQAGLVLDQRLSDADTLHARVYGGTRQLMQTLSMSGVAATSAGGVVDLDRGYGGVGADWTHKTRINGLPLNWTVGVDADKLHEARTGYVNNNGLPGALRRNEGDSARDLDFYGQLDWAVAPNWRVTAGARASHVKLDVHDYYVTAASPNDSGGVSYRKTSPVGGLVWSATDGLNIYANIGRGFETPTLAEVAYKAVGTGPNLGLAASTSVQGELGAKYKAGPHTLDVALFGARSDAEIVPTLTVNGRSVYQNVDGVRRRGMEAAWQFQQQRWTTHVSYTFLDATFQDAFVNASSATIGAGNRLPGAPRHSLFADADYHFTDAFSTALEVKTESKVYVNDVNSDAAGGYLELNARAGYRFTLAGKQLFVYGRFDNLLDQRYAGSVIVNDGNGRYFEPAPGRRFFVGLRAAL